ncbi:hypothetical protein B0H11DRAFT_1927874 [Mycena galericulata]|nr:hypothetical protein B0H11DRAFT_1927874 [Mycena galericulata]
MSDNVGDELKGNYVFIFWDSLAPYLAFVAATPDPISVIDRSVDPLISLMMVEKVPDSTYDGLDKQIKEIKEVIELPVKHPELFEALGIPQHQEKTSRLRAGL